MSSAQDLVKISNQMRADVLQMVFKAGSGHVAGPLSSADIFAALYFGNVVDHSIDKIVLSCGHYCPILYSALARKGLIPMRELDTFMQIGSRLPGHPERGLTPGVEVSAGPLGQGVSVAVGMALGLKLKSQMSKSKIEPEGRVYCVLSDGEIQEGQVWEAFNFAARRQLNNLVFILDRNRIQIENFVSQLATYGEVGGRLEAFGLHVLEIDGNNVESVIKVLVGAKNIKSAPTIIVANTIGGKGVSFMENSPDWHDKKPSEEQLGEALKELNV